MATVTAPTPAALAPLVRTPELDEVIVEPLAALSYAFHRLVVDGDLTDADLVAADMDADLVQRYLGVRQVAPVDRLGSWRWALDAARAAGLTGA